MKLFAFISVIASLLMLFLMYMFYSPILDDPDATTKERTILIVTLVLQFYFLIFSIYIMVKKGSIIKWESSEEKKS